jgi:fructosamine-3-kinase
VGRVNLSDDASFPDVPSVLPAEVVHSEPLAGGAANDVRRLTLADGSRVVLKVSDGASPGLFACEAEGLRELRDRGGLLTPRVIEVSTRHLVLEMMEPAPPGTAGFWAAAGRAVAGLHAVRGDRFGWHADGWLGLLPQENAWTDDGHEFFAEHRIRRYLREPKVRDVLDAADLAALDRICDRLPLLVPAAPSVLTHGDLYPGNIVATPGGEPAFIDPAVSWTWAEADLSMIHCTARPPEAFFAAYHELSPLAAGWRTRMPLLHLRELLSVLAHFGALDDYVPRIRAVIRRFS